MRHRKQTMLRAYHVLNHRVDHGTLTKTTYLRKLRRYFHAISRACPKDRDVRSDYRRMLRDKNFGAYGEVFHPHY